MSAKQSITTITGAGDGIMTKALCRDCRHWAGPEPGGYMGKCSCHGSWTIRTRPITTTPPPWVALELWTEPEQSCRDSSRRETSDA